MNRQKTAPVGGLLVGIALLLYGLYSGMHVLRIRLEGESTRAVLVRLEERGSTRHRTTYSVLNVEGTHCTVPGVVGHPGQTIPVHYRRSNHADCAVDGGIAWRTSLYFSVVGVVLLVASYFAMERMRRGEPGARFWSTPSS